MKKVYQTIVDPIKGNCMQAAIASLFELDLEEVPNFIELEDWVLKFKDMYKNRGYCYGILNLSERTTKDIIKKALKFDGGVKGYFYASVPSRRFNGCSHAVIIDSDLNVIHDPSPNNLWLDEKDVDIIDVVITKDFYIDKDDSIKLFE